MQLILVYRSRYSAVLDAYCWTLWLTSRRTLTTTGPELGIDISVLCQDSMQVPTTSRSRSTGGHSGACCEAIVIDHTYFIGFIINHQVTQRRPTSAVWYSGWTTLSPLLVWTLHCAPGHQGSLRGTLPHLWSITRKGFALTSSSGNF